MHQTSIARALAVLAAVVLLTSQMVTAGAQDFELFNRTGVDIHALYVSPSGEDDWGEDLLDGRMIEAGATVEIQFSGAGDAEYWDLRVEDEEGNSLNFEAINLLEASQVILNEDETARIK